MSAVLIVDDSPADRARFRAVLTRAGYDVHEAANGRDAVSMAREVRPRAIVLDTHLPDSDGHSVCRALKAERDTAALPVLLLTGRDDDAQAVAGLQAGADDSVARDSDPEVFLARLRRLILFQQLTTVAVLNEHLVQVGRLLAGIVHEIRGPLSVIRGNAELMRLQLPAEDKSQQWVEPILRSSEVLQVRLEHLMATVRGGPCVLETIELGPLVRESTDMFLKGSDPRGGKVAIQAVIADGLPRVRVDAGRLIQVLLSLLGNAYEAILASRRNGKVTVRTGINRDEGRDWVTVEVADDGPGIPEVYLERIFEPFFTTKPQGSGYGLYLASEIIKEQEGRLTARNVPDGGACFTLWLPTADAPTPAGAGSA